MNHLGTMGVFQDAKNDVGNRLILHNVVLNPGGGNEIGGIARIYATDQAHAVEQVEQAPEFIVKKLQMAAKWRVVNHESAPIVFENYASDGPGFSGCVEIILRGQQLLEIMTSQPPPSCFLYAMVFHKPFALVSSVEKMSKKYADDLWGVMPEHMQEYFLGSVDYLNLDQTRRLNFSDRTHGYLMLGGEPNFLIILQVSVHGKLLRHEGFECVQSGKIFEKCVAANSR